MYLFWFFLIYIVIQNTVLIIDARVVLNYMEDRNNHHYVNHQKFKSMACCPFYLGVGVTKENTTHSSTMWNTLCREKSKYEQQTASFTPLAAVRLPSLVSIAHGKLAHAQVLMTHKFT